MYPEYRDSGIEWIGKIPKEWEIDILQHLFRKETRAGFQNEELLSVYRDRGVIIKSSRDDNHNQASEDLSAYQLVEKGDLAINKMKAWQGSVAISQYRGIVSPAYYVCRPLSENDSKFLHYLLRSDIYIKQYERNSGGVRNNQWDLSYERFRKLEVILPDVQMQKKIAKYLDEKTALIDQIIEKKKKLIELLNEAVYSSSVVGMRGDVSDRNSLWQGEDASWLSKKAKWIFEEINIRNRPEEEMLAVTQDDGVVPKRLRQEQFVSSSSSEGLKLVGKNDFVISLRSFQGGIEYSMYKGLVSPAYTVIRLRKEYDTDFYRNYYKYLLKSPQFIGILNTVISGIRDGKNINFSDFKDIILPIPPTNSLNSMMALTKKVELLASYLKKQEKLFLEYKSSLISNVVTGKIKV